MASNSKRDFVLMLSIIVRMMSGMLTPLLVVVLRTSNDASLFVVIDVSVSSSSSSSSNSSSGSSSSSRCQSDGDDNDKDDTNRGSSTTKGHFTW